jgi:hypothetical protein
MKAKKSQMKKDKIVRNNSRRGDRWFEFLSKAELEKITYQIAAAATITPFSGIDSDVPHQNSVEMAIPAIIVQDAERAHRLWMLENREGNENAESLVVAYEE